MILVNADAVFAREERAARNRPRYRALPKRRVSFAAGGAGGGTR